LIITNENDFNPYFLTCHNDYAYGTNEMKKGPGDAVTSPGPVLR